MKATRTIELGKGATLEITSELNVLKTEGDSWEGIPAEYDIWIKTDFAFCMDGKRCENLMYRKKDATFKFWNWIPAEAEAILTKADVGLRIALKAENAEKVEKAIEETRNEVMTDEAREFFAKKEQAKKNGQKKRAEATVKEAEEIINNGGKLRTNKERAEWERNYNNVVNEGGEGYVPHYPSIEEYEEAKEILKK